MSIDVSITLEYAIQLPDDEGRRIGDLFGGDYHEDYPEVAYRNAGSSVTGDEYGHWLCVREASTSIYDEPYCCERYARRLDPATMGDDLTLELYRGALMDACDRLGVSRDAVRHSEGWYVLTCIW